MKKFGQRREFTLRFVAVFLGCIFSTSVVAKDLVVIGGGHVGLIKALMAYQRSKNTGEDLKITIYDKNDRIEQTTAANIWNSHTDDEIASVVPRGKELSEKLKTPFNQPGGIRVTDVANVNDSDSAKNFIKQVTIEGENEELHKERTQSLLKLGNAGMRMWKELFDGADKDLKDILVESNFNRCCENQGENECKLFNGYRVDLIYDVENAKERGLSMVETYQNLGYKMSKILSPDEVLKRDLSLSHFVNAHADNKTNPRQWHSDSVAVWRPGGCLDTQKFLPKLVKYLEKKMGSSGSKNGQDNFKIEFNKKVTGVIFDERDTSVAIKGLKFADGTTAVTDTKDTAYAFCPGEAVGTLHNLSLSEPAYAGFAGASLGLTIDIPHDQKEMFKDFKHYMEVHKIGVVLAWQARVRDGKIFVGVAGTKAFYGDVEPTVNDEFAKDRNLLQLQMINDVLPHIMSIALERDTRGQILTKEDLALLVEKGMAIRWVGRRSVVYDGFPTVGLLYHHDKVILNAQTVTHLGSGGGSFSHIMSLISDYALDPQGYMSDIKRLDLSQEFVERVLELSDSRRTASSNK